MRSQEVISVVCPVSRVQSSRNWEFLSLISVLGRPCHCLSPDLLSPVRVKAGGLTRQQIVTTHTSSVTRIRIRIRAYIRKSRPDPMSRQKAAPEDNARCTQIHPQIDKTSHRHCTALHRIIPLIAVGCCTPPVLRPSSPAGYRERTARRAVQSEKHTHPIPGSIDGASERASAGTVHLTSRSRPVRKCYAG